MMDSVEFFSHYVQYKENKAFNSDKFEIIEKVKDDEEIIDVVSDNLKKRYVCLPKLSDFDINSFDPNKWDRFFVITFFNDDNKSFLIKHFDLFFENNGLFFTFLDSNGKTKLNINPYLVKFSNFSDKPIKDLIERLIN